MKNKLIKTLLVTGTASSMIVPLASLSSCSKSKLVDLSKIYIPTIKPAEAQWYDSPADALTAYLNAIDSEKGGNPEIFRQDLLYTMSKGMQEYTAMYQQYCNVTRCEHYADVSNIRVKNVDDEDPTKVEKKVIFDLTFEVHFDISNNKLEDLIWMELDFPIYDITSKIEFTFDFNAVDAVNPDLGGGPIYQYRQMTSLGGTTQFGITEYGSSLRILSEKGTATNIYGEDFSIDTETPSSTFYFILPTKGYWNLKNPTQADLEYNKRYNSCYSLWHAHQGAQAAVLILKYYISSVSDPLLTDTTIRTLDFGSYYFTNANLNSFYTTDKEILYGFNISLDATKNHANVDKLPSTPSGQGSFDKTTSTLTLPTKVDSYTLTTISASAFSAAKSDFTNMSLPLQVLNLSIPGSYSSIEHDAFRTDYNLQSISFDARASKSVKLGYSSFYQMYSLITLDFSKQGTQDYKYFQYTGGDEETQPFLQIHNGADINNLVSQVTQKYGESVNGAEGVVIIPSGANEGEWSNWLHGQLGLKIFDPDHPENHGWAFKKA